MATPTEYAQKQSANTTSKMSVMREPTQLPDREGKDKVRESGSAPRIEVPGVPESSIQFQADWRQLRMCKHNLAQYFQVRHATHETYV